MQLIQLKATTKEKAVDYLNEHYKNTSLPNDSTAKVFLPDGSTKKLTVKGRYVHNDGTPLTSKETKAHIKKLATMEAYSEMWKSPDIPGSKLRFYQTSYYKKKPTVIKCSVCNKEKTITDFYECKKNQEDYECGYSSACVECLVIEINAFSRLFYDK